jgi:hypothetical protein
MVRFASPGVPCHFDAPACDTTQSVSDKTTVMKR